MEIGKGLPSTESEMFFFFFSFYNDFLEYRSKKDSEAKSVFEVRNIL